MLNSTATLIPTSGFHTPWFATVFKCGSLLDTPSDCGSAVRNYRKNRDFLSDILISIKNLCE